MGEGREGEGEVGQTVGGGREEGGKINAEGLKNQRRKREREAVWGR